MERPILPKKIEPRSIFDINFNKFQIPKFKSWISNQRNHWKKSSIVCAGKDGVEREYGFGLKTRTEEYFCRRREERED